MANGTSTARADKAKVVDEVKGLFDKATSVVFLGFKGMDVITVTDLRSKFRKAGVEYKVVKNKLVEQALKGTPLEGKLGKVLAGETAVAFSFEDPSTAAKVVRDFRKEGDKQEKLEVKAAVLDNAVMAGGDVEKQLASMPGKDELRAMLLATLQAPAQNLVAQLQAPLQNLVYVLEARRKQLEESSGG
ncbi:50S ribosomal protein L10 [Sandaracinus amylolyticus]|uniref:Large ribosomal subunit protein uL10 n=1 Tax=Sandaracinus amylolyticus TaxID=927083 RepID=A0A0F6W281_9BACT|nr:50S ribosomal protein L10 [Sandaracinus amylolyticus]AKF05548.1 LSU ribosomal protein L10p (P0) [Sandaracinus amylolyticus]